MADAAAEDLASLSRRLASDGRYTVLERVGAGSMGTVYRVHDREMDCAVALKAIPGGAAEKIYRLKQEFRSLAGLSHPNLIELHDLVVGDPDCFFTMEFVEGADFVAHVRGAADDGPARRQARFLAAAPQLARGLAALHAAGRLHRDVKPGNVRVDPAGRVVLLDFDLATPLDAVGVQEDTRGELSGTLAYMAPEQLWGLETSPASDLYAMGVVFHEALLGAHPFADAPPPGEGPVQLDWDPELPAWLRELVSELLDPAPERRPTLSEVIRRLGAGGHAEPGGRGRAAAARFVGRERELARLEQAAARSGTRVVGVHGVSGLGKTELVRRFLADRIETKGALVLQGRCHPQEAVPFQALDPLVDDLSIVLRESDAATRARLLPEHAGVLARLFPVLARVPDLPQAAEAATRDVVEVRRRGVGALRELLRRLAEQGPLVLWVDDAQWSDADSAALLGELLRPPAAPELLLVLTYRSDDRQRVALLRSVEEIAGESASLHFEEIAVEPLPLPELVELARGLCPPELAATAPLAELAAESGGSPFFLGELVWHLREAAGAASPATLAGPVLADVIQRRLAQLGHEERLLLELVSICGGPAERSLVLEAARLGERGRPLVQRLEGVGLLRTTPVGGSRAVETYHDRIRETVAAGIPAGSLPERHRALAQSFEASGRVEPETLASHFHGAGALPEASRYALAAARRAADALAFVRAAELYRSARDWHPGGPDRERELMAFEADALAKGARLVEGGRLFLAAAAGAPTAEALELRRRAAEHLVSGGDLDAGTSVLRPVLAELGLGYPATPRRALVGSLTRLLSVALRSYAAAADAPPLEPRERIRIDLCYAIGVRLVDADSARGIYFSLESLVRALRARDPARMARSLCAVGGSLSVVGGPLFARLGERMVAAAEELAERVDAPELTGTIHVGLAQVLMLAGRCREAVERGDQGVRILSEQCQGHAFECNFGRANALRALEELGRLGEVETRAQELRAAAAAVGNRYAETAGSQYLAIARIARGDVAGARELARHGRALWTRADFHIQHLYAARIEVLCDLYEARPDEGWARLDEIEAPLRRSGLLRIPLTRTDVHSLRGQLALARAEREAREPWLERCRRHAGTLARIGRTDAVVHGRLLEAGVARLRGRSDAARAHLEAAASLAERGELALRAACARLRSAELAQDGATRAEALRAMEAGGVHEPERWAGLYAPGFRGASASQRGANGR